jgi:hypothetical protein
VLHEVGDRRREGVRHVAAFVSSLRADADIKILVP